MARWRVLLDVVGAVTLAAYLGVLVAALIMAVGLGNESGDLGSRLIVGVPWLIAGGLAGLSVGWVTGGRHLLFAAVAFVVSIVLQHTVGAGGLRLTEVPAVVWVIATMEAIGAAGGVLLSSRLFGRAERTEHSVGLRA